MRAKGTAIRCMALDALLRPARDDLRCQCAAFVLNHLQSLHLSHADVRFTRDVTEAEFQAWIVEWAMENEK